MSRRINEKIPRSEFVITADGHEWLRTMCRHDTCHFHVMQSLGQPGDKQPPAGLWIHWCWERNAFVIWDGRR